MKVSDFRVGDRVIHSSCGAGIVEKIDSAGMHVAFANSRNRGIYDDNWFRICEPKGTAITLAPKAFSPA